MRAMEAPFDKPIVTVDIVPLTLQDDRLCVLRAVRDRPPFAGQPALIGGFVHTDADMHLGETARRVLADKADLRDLYVEQLSTFSGADRDPRGWSASVAYFSLSPIECLQSALRRDGLELVRVEEAVGMPFDHDRILDAALDRLRGKGAYSDLPARFLLDSFTLAELHEVYQIALGEALNIDAFRRKVMERDFVEPTGEKRRAKGAKRPAALYRLKGESAVFARRL